MICDYKKTGNPFLDYGLGYIYTVKTEPVLFKSIYVDNILNLKMTDIIPKKQMIKVMRQDECTSGVPDEVLLEIAAKSWFLAHGIALLIASGMLIYDEEKVKKILIQSI